MKTPELAADPFQERSALELHREIYVLGAHIRFESNSEDLLRLVDAAYAGLPRHKLTRVAPRLRIRMLLTTNQRSGSRVGPAPLHMMSEGGLLAGATGPSNFVVVSPNDRGALVLVTPRMLGYKYHTRYELIEFAVFTLAVRVQGLVALHAACVGHDGRGVLLLGPSGAGKSTLIMQCLAQGWQILAEDGVFVTPGTLLATGVSNFVHVRADSTRWIGPNRLAARVRSSPIIRRRTGVRKYEVDLRHGGCRLAEHPLKIDAVVFLSAEPANGRPLLRSVEQKQALAMLVREQAYAANQPPWPVFERAVKRVPFFELRRGAHPRESVAALRTLRV